MVTGELKEREAEDLENNAKAHVENKDLDYVKRYEDAEEMFNQAIAVVTESRTYFERALPLFRERNQSERVNYVEKKIRLLAGEPERLAATRDATIYAGG